MPPFRLWPIHLMLRAAGWLGLAALAGSTITTATASRLLLPKEVLLEAAAVQHSSAPSLEQKPIAPPQQQQLEAARKREAAKASAAMLVEHNPFCPSCRPVEAVQDPAQALLAPAATELPLVLLATMVSDDPQESMASIADTAHGAAGVFGVDEQLRAGVVVTEIRPGRVLLRTQAGLRTLDLPDPRQPKSKSKQRKPNPKPTKPGSREIEGAREAINCRGNDCTVERKFVEALIANPRQLARQAKLIPAVKDGEIRGFRLSRIRHGTLPKLLGLRNGDTLMAVNGTQLDSMDRAIGLYTTLRRASNLSVTVERSGKVFDKHIAIR